MSTKETVKAQIQSLINLANTTTGNTDTNLTDGVNALVSGYGQGGDLPTDTLVGLANGYDVMFYDENNEGLAFYSIKEGHSIEAPIYNCKAWQTSDGANVTFPYTPSADAIFYALNSTYADQLYEFYGVDRAVYPYLCIRVSTTNVKVMFAKQYSSTGTKIQLGVGYYGSKSNIANAGYSDDLPTMISNIMSLVTSVEYTSTTSKLSFTDPSSVSAEVIKAQLINFVPSDLGYTATTDYINLDE